MWAVLLALGEPPPPGTEKVALSLVRQGHPAMKGRTLKAILREWREYAEVARSPDWDDLEDDGD